jgi:uncharacterized membrane protein (UPF0127 family)
MSYFKKIFIFLFFIFLLTGCSSSEKQNIVKINNKEFKVELAQSDEETYRGLSSCEELCEDCGMLFIFPEIKERTFVMRNMFIPLDIIFIKDNKVLNIHKNLKPEGEIYKGRYNSKGPSNYVLEINAGMSDFFGIKEGDEILINLAK